MQPESWESSRFVELPGGDQHQQLLLALLWLPVYRGGALREPLFATGNSLAGDYHDLFAFWTHDRRHERLDNARSRTQGCIHPRRWRVSSPNEFRTTVTLALKGTARYWSSSSPICSAARPRWVASSFGASSAKMPRTTKSHRPREFLQRLASAYPKWTVLFLDLLVDHWLRVAFSFSYQESATLVQPPSRYSRVPGEQRLRLASWMNC